MSPSRELPRTDSDSIRTPDCSVGATISIIACMIDGTPAMTMTLPILKPGRQDRRALDQVGAIGNPGHPQPRLVQFARILEALLEARDHVGMMVDADAERLGDAVGGDVVMGRADAARGEDIGITSPAAHSAPR